MDQLLQTFETPFIDRDGNEYDVLLYGRSRPSDTWQGWLVFVRRSDQRRFTTDTETTQPSAEAVLYWATGLSEAYFEGAFERALEPVRRGPIAAAPPPLHSADHATYLQRLVDLQALILRSFTRRQLTQLSTEVVLGDLPHTHADVVRALEDMEKQRRLLVRRTEDGNDWLILTETGARVAGVTTAHVGEKLETEPPRPPR